MAWNESIDDRIIRSGCYSAGDCIPDPVEVVIVSVELWPTSISGYEAECGENRDLF